MKTREARGSSARRLGKNRILLRFGDIADEFEVCNGKNPTRSANPFRPGDPESNLFAVSNFDRIQGTEQPIFKNGTDNGITHGKLPDLALV